MLSTRRLGHHAARIRETVDQCIEDNGRCNDHTRLEASAGTKVAVELHVQRKDEDERQEHLGDDPQDQIALHFGCSLRLRRRRSSATTPAPAVKTTVVSPSVS